MPRSSPMRPVVLSTNPPAAGPVRRVAGYTSVPAGEWVDGGPATPVYVVSAAQLASGQFWLSGDVEPLPMVAITDGRPVEGRVAPVPVYVVSGSLDPTPSPVSPLLTGLTAFWPVNPPGQLLTDLHTNALTLTDNGGVGSAVGLVYPQVGSFNGTSQSLSRASSAILSTGDIDFTIAAWVKLAAVSAFAGVAGKWRVPDTSNRELLLFLNSSRFAFGVSTTGADQIIVTDTTVLATGVWYFVVGWHDSVANTINVQVNNAAPVTLAHSGGVRAGTADFVLGRLVTTLYLNGNIGPVMLWKRVLSASERTQVHNSGVGLPYPFS